MMSFLRVVFLFFTAVLASISMSAEVATCSKAAGAERLFKARKAGIVPKPIESWDDTDVLNNDLDIEVVHSTQNVSGFNRMTIRSNVANLTQFTFRLANTFTISSVTLNGLPISFTRLDSITVRANFSAPVTQGQTFTLQINYGGPATAGAGFGSMVFTTQNSQPLDFTLSEPYYSYTWWPAKDDNDDKALNSIAVTVPNTMKVAANGRLQGTDVVAGGKLKYRYACSYPMDDYLLMFAATNYNEWTLTYNFAGGSMPCRFMIYPTSDTAANRNAWGLAVTMLGVYEPLFGFYPFRNDQYGIYQFAFGGGMEHQTFTGQGTFSESVTSHELGHQWWGDMITCRHWEDIWLNEGFATYVEALWLQYKPGSTGWPALKTAMANRKPTSYNGTVYRTDTSSTNSIFSSNFAYRKGGWVLHMYRHIVGETMFWQTLQNWRGLYQYAAADTQDFIAVAEQTTGQDLNWFFDPWIYQIGGIRFTLGSTNVVLGGQNYLLLKIDQSQTAGYPIYRMPVDVRYTDGSGVQTRVVTLTTTPNWYALPTNGAASAISLDPDGWVLTTGTNQTQIYTDGPPKIVSVSPAQGLASDKMLRDIKVTFHTNVTATSADFVLRSKQGIRIPFALKYDAATFTARIIPNPIDVVNGYALTVKDTIKSVANGMVLDGEVSAPSFALPSGNGTPGGSAQFSFGR